MFRIDYSCARKFLMSFGLTLVFASVVIIWTEVLFFVDRAENVLLMCNSDSSVADEYAAIIGPIIKAIPYILNAARIVFFLGVGLFLAGIVWWVLEELNNKNTQHKIKKIVSMIKKWFRMLRKWFWHSRPA